MIKYTTAAIGYLLLAAATANAYHPEVDAMDRVRGITNELIETTHALEHAVETSCDRPSRNEREVFERVQNLHERALQFRDTASRYHRHPEATERDFASLLRAFERVEHVIHHLTGQRQVNWHLQRANALIDRLVLYYAPHEHVGARGYCEVHGDYGDWGYSDRSDRDDDHSACGDRRPEPRRSAHARRDRHGARSSVGFRVRW